MNKNQPIVVIHSKNRLHGVIKNILVLPLGSKSKLKSRADHELCEAFFGKPFNPYCGYFMTDVGINSAVV